MTLFNYLPGLQPPPGHHPPISPFQLPTPSHSQSSGRLRPRKSYLGLRPNQTTDQSSSRALVPSKDAWKPNASNASSRAPLSSLWQSKHAPTPAWMTKDHHHEHQTKNANQFDIYEDPPQSRALTKTPQLLPRALPDCRENRENHDPRTAASVLDFLASSTAMGGRTSPLHFSGCNVSIHITVQPPASPYFAHHHLTEAAGHKRKRDHEDEMQTGASEVKQEFQGEGGVAEDEHQAKKVKLTHVGSMGRGNQRRGNPRQSAAARRRSSRLKGSGRWKDRR